MSDRPIFLRPIYFSPTVSGHFEIDSTEINIVEGVYGSILTLLSEIKDEGNDEIASFDVTIDSNFKVTLSADDPFTFDFGENASAALLGFDDTTLSGSDSYTATYTPSHLWFPSFAQSNQSDFRLMHKDRFRGRTSIDGGISGIKLDGGNIYYKDFAFEFEPAVNVMDIFSTDPYERERNFDAFVDGARFSIPDSSSEVATTGFYYYPDYTDAMTLTTSMLSNSGINLNYTSSGSTHVFCNLNPNSTFEPVPSLPVGVDRWNLSFSVNSATPPSWTALL